MVWFNIATLTPVVLLAMAGWHGDVWIWAALAYLTLVVFAFDKLVEGRVARDEADGRAPDGLGLSIALGLLHFPLLALAVAAVAGYTGLDVTERVGAFAAFGLFFGQISNSNAHELIHRTTRGPMMLGRLVYVSLLFGHHASAHLRVHHVFVATEDDPNSPRPGQGFYRFALQAWPGSFRAGLKAETARMARRPGPLARLAHPYLLYVGGAVLCLSAASTLAGTPGVLALAGLAAYAQMQLLLSDYVQHYGLRRQRRPDGRLEPVGPQHSWNSPNAHSAAMMLNAPLHSDHHMHPGRTYPALEIDPATMPVLPHSLPVMAVLALVPPLFRRVMSGALSRRGQAEARHDPLAVTS